MEICLQEPSVTLGEAVHSSCSFEPIITPPKENLALSGMRYDVESNGSESNFHS